MPAKSIKDRLAAFSDGSNGIHRHYHDLLADVGFNQTEIEVRAARKVKAQQANSEYFASEPYDVLFAEAIEYITQDAQFALSRLEALEEQARGNREVCPMQIDRWIASTRQQIELLPYLNDQSPARRKKLEDRLTWLLEQQEVEARQAA